MERRCIYTALSNSKSSPDSVFFSVWPQNQKKASPDPFHENMVRQKYLVRTVTFLWVRSSTFETKSLQSRRSSFICRPKLDMSDLIDSNIDLFMYLIVGIRFGTWKDKHLNWALFSFHSLYKIVIFQFNKPDKIFFFPLTLSKVCIFCGLIPSLI